MASYTSVYTRAQLKSRLQHTGTRSAAAWPSCRMYHRPALFFRHLNLVVLSFPQAKIRPAKSVNISVVHFFQNCVGWGMFVHNKLPKCHVYWFITYWTTSNMITQQLIIYCSWKAFDIFHAVTIINTDRDQHLFIIQCQSYTHDVWNIKTPKAKYNIFLPLC
jgi:hypothetical protein